MTAEEIIAYMCSLRDERQRLHLMRFFKTGEGDYGEGDEFLGLKVPQTRKIVKAVADDVPLREIPKLLQSKWHEIRLCGLLILVAQFEKVAKKRLETDNAAMAIRDEIVKLYLDYSAQANNWDLVDLSAPKIMGHWLLLPTNLGDKQSIVDELAASTCLWKQRISVVCTWWPTRHGEPSWCLRYAEKHLHHSHDLMHKAVGWMLREMGKNASLDLLRDFLHLHAKEMPRTTLRYAIEKMDCEERRHWMNL